MGRRATGVLSLATLAMFLHAGWPPVAAPASAENDKTEPAAVGQGKGAAEDNPAATAAGDEKFRAAAPEGNSRPPEVEPQSIDDAPVGVIVHFKEKGGRPFSFYVPKSYDKTRLYPLLIECTGVGLGRKNVTGVWPLAEKFDLIVASADTWAGHGQPESKVAPDRTLKGWSREDGEIDVPVVVREMAQILKDLRADAEAVAGLVALLGRTYSVSRRAVVLTGYSGGAWVAYYVGLSDPGRYAGICVRSGSFCTGIVPSNFAPARKMPIQVVVGENDLDVVLEETAAAEGFFKANKFENFQVERLPNSGHDYRPEVAGNFVRFLWRKVKVQLWVEMRPQYERCLEAARSALERGEAAKAREWFEKAARMERELELPARAGEELKKLDAGSRDADKAGEQSPVTERGSAPASLAK